MSRPLTVSGASAKRTVSPHRGSTAPLILSAIALLALLLGVGGYFFFSGDEDSLSDPLVHVVERGQFIHVVSQKGEFESSNNIEVRCQVKARNSAGTEIIEVVDEGTLVEEGHVLARLDSSSLQLDLVQQQISCSRSEALTIKARNTHEAAEIAKTEYEKGKYEQEKQDLEKEIFKAEENLRRADQHALYSERLVAKGYLTEMQLVGDRFAVEEARKELESANTKLRILEEYTREKEVKQLDADVKTAAATWKAEQRSYELEMQELKDIEEQIEMCTMKAPVAGTVVHANRKSYRGSSNEFIVEAGASVRENQVLFRLPDRSQMQVKTEVGETDIALVEKGMKARIRMGTSDDEVMYGEVTKVNEYPEPSWSSSVPKEYMVFVEIDDPPPTLRTGLTAKVEIVINQMDDVLQVPVQAVHLHGERYYCIVQDKEGDWYATRVTIGPTNNESVIIHSGLEEGMRISMTPNRYLDRVDLPEAPSGQSRPKNGQGKSAPNGQSRPTGAGGGR